jgi:putative FmdB family regulatory protein
MPIYEYECRKCGVFEHSQSINDGPLKRCPECRSGVQKLLSAPAFHLKGGGWYSDGYGKTGDSSGAKGSAGDGAKSAGDASSTDAKPAGGSGESAKSGKSKSSKGPKTAGA